jgi:hypothetical protein
MPTDNMSSSSAPSSCFDNVPNEVLEHIISFIPWWEEVICCGDYYGSYRTVTQAMILMQVSRRFRLITQSSKFWRESDFYFEHLLPWSDKRRPSAAARCASLVRVLFDDAYFKSCLRRKSDWNIRSARVLRALRDYLPFSRVVRCVCIDLPIFSDDMVPILSQLSKCRNLSTLFVDSSKGPELELSLIPTWLPHIKHLHISLPSDLKGSLHGLTALESLGLHKFYKGAPVGNEVLPPGSAKTLTRLDLGCPLLDDDFNLRDFANVQHLIVNTFQNEHELNILAHFPSKLTSFEGVINLGDPEFPFEECPDQWQRFLASPCFVNLRQICLQVTCWTNIENFGYNLSYECVLKYIERCMDILEEISTQMVLLEKIEFWGSMDLDRVYYVKRWKHLESLLWVIPTDFFLGDRELDLTAIVLGYFGDVARQPKVTVKEKVWYLDSREVKEAGDKEKFMFGTGNSWLL